MSADPHIQAPTDTQSLNRYSYVLNNPMSATDPSGYFFKKYWRAIASIVISIYLPGAGGFMDTLNAVQSGALTGFVAGGVATGSWKGALTGAFTGALFGHIGDKFQNVKGFDLNKVAAHGFAGGVSSVLNDGKFGHGFASAGMTQALSKSGLFTEKAQGWDRVKNAVKAAIVGGTMSVATGGKFQNGAVTGVFSRLLNDGKHPDKSGKESPQKKQKFSYAPEAHVDDLQPGYANAMPVSDGKGGMKVYIYDHVDPRLHEGLRVHENVHIDTIKETAISLDFLNNLPENITIVGTDVTFEAGYEFEQKAYRAERDFHQKNIDKGVYKGEKLQFLKEYVKDLNDKYID